MVKGFQGGWGLCSCTVVFDDYPLALSYWKDTIAVGFASSNIITLDAITGSQVALLSGHTDYVRSVTFSSDGTSLVSGYDEKTLKLWDVQTGGVIKTFHGHTHWVLSVSISLDHTRIASGSCDSTIHLWGIQTGECYCIISQLGQVSYVSFSPTNSQHLISISGGVVHQWDIDGHQIGPTYQGSYAAFTLDGTCLALCGGNVTTVQNSNSGATVAKFLTDKDPKYCCFSPDGTLIAIAIHTTAYVWDITGSDPHLIHTFVGHITTINSLAFSSSSSTLLSGSNGHSIKFWQIGASSTNLVASNPEDIPLASASIRSVNLHAESGIAISIDFDRVVEAWVISTGLCKGSSQTLAKGETWGDAQMADGRLVVAWFTHGKIHIWDVKKGELFKVVETAQDGARDLRISGDGFKVFLLIGRFIQAWSMSGDVVGQEMWVRWSWRMSHIWAWFIWVVQEFVFVAQTH